MNAPPNLRLVLDTNTVMALWHFADPALRALRTCVEGGGARLLASEATIEELRRVLAYRQFGLTPDRQQALLDVYVARAARVTPDAAPEPLPACRDGDDQKFLELARDGTATHLLTRDKALLRLNRHRLIRARFEIRTPEAFSAQYLSMPPPA